MQNYFLLRVSGLLVIITLYNVGFASPPQAKTSSLSGFDIQEMTIKAKLEVASNYDSM